MVDLSRSQASLRTLSRCVDGCGHVGHNCGRNRAALPDVPIKLLAFEDLKADPIAVVRETCRHLGIDPNFAFVPMPPLNTRSKLPASQSVGLLPRQRAALAERLAPEMHRLAEEYDFDVSRWGFA